LKAKPLFLAAILPLLLLHVATTVAQSLPIHAIPPKHEVRAVWLTTIGGIDWPHSYSAASQRRELSQILDQLKLANVNTVLVQTRIRATTIYPSTLEPWDGCLSGTPGRSPGYDALQLVIDECHRRGMECHAWVVTMPVGKWNKLGCQQLRRHHPQLVRRLGDEGYMDPSNPGTASYLAQLCAEVTRNYDIDGIHLDYIRYPEAWPKARRTTEHDARRRHITAIVTAIHHAVKVIKPWVKLSCSPVGKATELSRYRSGGWNAYHAVSQDAQGWLRQGLMDQLYPMQYFRGNQFFPFALDWQERSYGRTIISGLGIYFLSPSEGNWPIGEVKRQLHFARDNRLGHAYFRSKFLTDNTKGIYNFIRDFDHSPALIPPMTWAWSQPPTAPTHLSLTRTDKADRLSWDGATDHSRAPYLLYNIYASTTPDVDTSDPRCLVATRLMATTATLPHSPGATLHYAVTALDRYGNESQPCLTSPQAKDMAPHHQLLLTDGKRLNLPPKGNILDAAYVAIVTLQGQVVATLPYRDRQADISRLDEGVYELRSIGRKGISHRLGFFAVKRGTH